MTQASLERIGSYNLKQILGQGGMGVVYLAEDERTGQVVALKVLHATGHGSLRMLSRELRALKALDHPGVGKVLDEGGAQGQAWFAMELRRGKTLASVLREDIRPSTGPGPMPDSGRVSWTERLAERRLDETLMTEDSLPEALPLSGNAPAFAPPQGGAPAFLPARLRVGQRAASGVAEKIVLEQGVLRRLRWVALVAQALEYIHGEGLTHLDVKPENILVCDGGARVVLLDFGLAQQREQRISAESLEGVGLFAGTVRYMAPEQVQGHALDARTDLYALGCVLYRVLTGRTPFDGDNTMELARAHVSSPPMSPSTLGVELPPALESLIMALLAKIPRQRPAHAGIVIDVLHNVGVDVSPLERAPTARPHTYEAGFQGRSAQFSRAMRAFEVCAAGQSAALAIVGASGVGKSRLAKELVRHARQNEAQVIVGQCRDTISEQEARPALHAFDRLLNVAHQRALKPDEGLSLRQVLGGEHAAALSLFHQGFEALAQEAAPPRGAAIKGVLRAALRATVAALAHKPLVLIFEDVHQADPLSLAHLTMLRDDLESCPGCLVVCTAQSAVGEGGLSACLDESRAQRLMLAGLGEHDMREMVRQMLGGDVAIPADFMQALLRTADGNPFFIVEAMRWALDEGVLRRETGGGWRIEGGLGGIEALIEGAVMGLLGARLEQLQPDVRLTLEAAAVLGREVEVHLLEHVCGQPPQVLAASLIELSRRGILEADNDRWRFVHSKLRSVAYLRMSVERRHALHVRVVEVLEERYGQGLGVELETLGQHLELIGAHGRAAQIYLEAAELDGQRFALLSAERLFVKAGFLAEPGSATALRAGWKLARMVFLVQSRIQEAHVALEAVLEQAREHGEEVERTGALMSLAQLSIMQGRLDDADGLLAEAIVLLEAQNNGRHLAHAQTMAGIVSLKRERYDDALRVWSRAMETARALGDLALVSATQINIAIIHQRAGRYQQALDLQRQTLAYYRTTQHTEGEGNALNNICALLCERGDFGDFDGLCVQAETIWEALGDDFSRSYALLARGKAARLRGIFDESQRCLEDSLDLRQGFGDASNEATVLVELAHLEVDRGDGVKACQWARRALACFEPQTRSDEAGQAALALVRGLVLASQPDEAREVLAQHSDHITHSPLSTSLIEFCCLSGLLEPDASAQWFERARAAYDAAEMEPMSHAGQRLAELKWVVLGTP